MKAPVLSADLDALSLAARTTENLPLITTGAVNGAPITWTSSDAALVTPTNPAYTAPAVGAADPFKDGGVISRPAYGEGDRSVTLTATATLNGATASRTFTVAVAEKARWAPDAGYAAAYFKADNDEKIYQAATSGNNFFSFAPVNGGAPVITSTADTTGLRDPYVIRSARGRQVLHDRHRPLHRVHRRLGGRAVQRQPQDRGVGIDRHEELGAHQRPERRHHDQPAGSRHDLGAGGVLG